MATILLRIFLVYNLLNRVLLYLVPKKLRTYLPSSWYPQQTPNNNNNNTIQGTTRATLPPSPRRMDTSELRRVFQMFDKNGDGKITQKELNDSLEKMGIFIPASELTQMIDKIDANGDGFLDIDEFGALYLSIMDERDEEEAMKGAFGVFDQNGDGFITGEELRSVLRSLGLKQGKSMEDCKRMITKIDEDGDGMVSFKEFKEMMRGGGCGGGFASLS